MTQTPPATPGSEAPFDRDGGRCVLFCCLASPGYYRRPLFARREVFCGPDCPDQTGPEGVIALQTPPGDYDLPAVVARLPAHQRPDLVVIKADASRRNLPRNLDAVPCPKVLLVGDTHHYATPLRSLTRYAGAENFDFILLDHTRHHGHFFREAGFEQVYWSPALDYALRRRAIPDKPGRPLVFVGEIGAFHPYRRHVLESVVRAGLPLSALRAPPEQTADLYADAGISLNCSLNGDLNLRVFEVLGSGGFLITDALAPASGLDRLFEAGRHLVTYRTIGELIETIRHYLDHPDEAMAIRRAGQAHLLATQSPALKLGQFYDLLDHGRVDPALEISEDRRTLVPVGREALTVRMEAYEAIQRLHLRSLRLRLYVDEADSLGAAANSRDLPRIKTAGYDQATRDRPPARPPGEAIGLNTVLVLPWPLPAAEAGQALLARLLPGFGHGLVLAPGRTRRERSLAAAALAPWGFHPTEPGAALFYCPRHSLALDRSHPEALRDLAQQAEVEGRYADAFLHISEYLRIRPPTAPGSMTVLEQLADRDRDDPRVQTYRSVFRSADRPSCGRTRRILVLTNLFPPQEFGGYGRKLWEFSAELVRRGHEVRILAADAPEWTRPGMTGTLDLEPRVERSLELFGRWRNGTAYNEAPARCAEVVRANNQRLIDAARRHQSEVVLAGNIDLMTPNAVTLLSQSGLPVIHCVGNSHPGYTVEGRPQSPLYRIGPASEWVGRVLTEAGFRFPAMTVLYPGARTDFFYRPFPPAFDRLRIAFASLFVVYKGPHVLINALALLHGAGVDFECTFAGETPDGDLLGRCRDFAARSGFADKLRFPGFLDRQGLARLFDGCNTLVFPSVFEEPFGISHVEAMAAGLAVVSSGTGGSREIVRDGVDGLLFKPEDHTDLAVKLKSLTDDPARWAALARAGQARSLDFTVGRSVDRIEATFEELLAYRP